MVQIGKYLSSLSRFHPRHLTSASPERIPAMPLLTDIERHLARHHMSPSRFGRDALRDPRLVFDLRRGRGAGPKVRRRIETFLSTHTTTATSTNGASK
jgi:hypothetical protein